MNICYSFIRFTRSLNFDAYSHTEVFVRKNLPHKPYNLGAINKIMDSEIHPMNYLAGIAEVSPQLLLEMVHKWSQFDEEGRVAVLKMLSWQIMGQNEVITSLFTIGQTIDRLENCSDLAKAHLLLGFDSHRSHHYNQMNWFLEGRYGDFVQCALRCVELQNRLSTHFKSPEPTLHSQSTEEVSWEYRQDLEWYLDNKEPLFEGPSFHRLQAAAMCMVLEGLRLPTQYLEALEDFSSTGFSSGFIVAQLYLFSDQKDRARELLESLLSTFGDALPPSDDTGAFFREFQSEFLHDITTRKNLVPQNLPWGDARSAKYWDSVLSLKEVWS